MKLHPPAGVTVTEFIDQSGQLLTPDGSGFYDIGNPTTAGYLLVAGWGTQTCVSGPANFLKPASGALPWKVVEQPSAPIAPAGGYFTISDGPSAGALIKRGWVTRAC